MRVERAEAAGLGVALVAHVALLWALSLHPAGDPVPPPMEVSFVEETGLQSSAPTSEPAAASVAPEIGAPEEAAPAPAPESPPTPDPRPVPQPAPSARPAAPRQALPAPAPAPQGRVAAPPRLAAPARGSAPGTAPASRASRLGPDLLKGLGDEPAARSTRPAGAVVSDQARASMDAALNRALQPCRRQPIPAPEAAAIRVRVEVILSPDGSLSSARVLSVANATGNLAIYERRMRDLATNVIEQCAPIRGLPAEYYSVARGWRRFVYTFPA